MARIATGWALQFQDIQGSSRALPNQTGMPTSHRRSLELSEIAGLERVKEIADALETVVAEDDEVWADDEGRTEAGATRGPRVPRTGKQ